MPRFLTFVIFALGSLGAAQGASADTPLGPPGRFTQCSANGIFCVEMIPDSDGTVFRKDSDGRRTNLWVIPGWHRAVFVSDNGHHLVKCYGGLNLVPIRFDPAMTLVEIWRDGVRKHQLSLRAVVGDPSKMIRTVSHYAWGRCGGFESEMRFVLFTAAYDSKPPNDLVERKVIVEVETGKLIRTNEITRQ